jgi:hypothetical protein
LELPDHTKVYRVYVGIAEDIGAIVITQIHDMERPVYMTGRKLLLSELKLTLLE